MTGMTEQVSGDGFDPPEPASGGNGIKPYSGVRKSGLWTLFLSLGVAATVGWLVYRFTPHGEGSLFKTMEVLANLSVAVGTFILAKGAVLTFRQRRWLKAVLKQEEDTRTRFARRTITYQYLLELAERIKSGDNLDPLVESLQEALTSRKSGVHRLDFKSRHNRDALQKNWVYVISQRDIAQMMLDAGTYAFWGTLFTGFGVVGITLLLAVSK